MENFLARIGEAACFGCFVQAASAANNVRGSKDPFIAWQNLYRCQRCTRDVASTVIGQAIV